MKMKRSQPKQKEGLVQSNRLPKTVVVVCERKYRHPKYNKVVRAYSKFKAHDEKQQCQVGDRVLIKETRPLSSDKYFRVVKILGKGAALKRELPKKREKERVDTGTEQITSSGQ